MRSQTSSRAGRYVSQPTGYKAFVPSQLPPNPALVIDDEILELLSFSDRALGRLDGATNTLKNPELFVLMYLKKEAVLSSQIEGTQASLTDVLELEAKVMSPDAPDDVLEIVNYINAMNYGLNRLKELPVSLRLIREIHERLMQSSRGFELQPGSFRTSQNWIGPSGSNLNNAAFIPPAPYDMTVALGEWENYIHHTEYCPLLIKIGLAHAQFETIHPFLDGNGRMGRMLITFLLCEQKVLNEPLLYLSYFFKQNRQEYYDRLQAVRDHGDWESWIKFFLKGVGQVANDATKVAKKINQLREDDTNKLASISGRSLADCLNVQEYLFAHPFITIAKVQEIIKKEFPAASRIAKTFVKAGILHEISGRNRYRVYCYKNYLDAFNDSEVLVDEVI